MHSNCNFGTPYRSPILKIGDMVFFHEGETHSKNPLTQIKHSLRKQLISELFVSIVPFLLF